MKIAVCDDRPEHLKKIRELLEKYQQTRPGLESQAEYFLSGAELLDQAEERGGYDLYLLDILMPGENGISVGKRLRQMGKQGELIFLTSSNDYAADSYEVRAFFYLLKPVEEEKLFRVLDQAVEKLTQQEKKTLLLETREGTRCVPLDRILYAERAGRVMRCHCTDGVLDSQTLRMPFREAAAPLLADPRFYLCGASFVLNFRHVTSIKGQEALLDNGEALTLPRTAAVEFKRAWGDYWLKENARWIM